MVGGEKKKMEKDKVFTRTKPTKKEIEHFKEVFARFGDDTVVRCEKCGRTQYLKFENGLMNGWSKCCNGMTMPIIYHQANINKAVEHIVKRSMARATIKTK